MVKTTLAGVDGAAQFVDAAGKVVDATSEPEDLPRVEQRASRGDQGADTGDHVEGLHARIVDIPAPRAQGAEY